MKACAYTWQDWKDLEARLQTALSPHRFMHTIGVTYTACALAMRYETDAAQVRLAGLLHDCAKPLSAEELLRIGTAHGWDFSAPEKQNAALLHAPVGSILARTHYGVEEEEICSAIRWHTTGRPDMTLLEKIIFVADYIEPNRDRAPRLQELRTMAFRDLDHTVAAILVNTLEYVKQSGDPLDPMTKEAALWYQKQKAGKELQ